MRNRVWKKAVVLALLSCLLACCAVPGAQAEDFFTLNVDMLDMDSLNQNDYVAANLSAACQGIRVLKTISTSSELAEPVRLSLTRMDTQTLLFDKDYGYQSRNFDSDVIYLPYGGGSTVPYLVTLYVGDTVYAMPFMQLQPRLQFNSACTYGVRLRDLGLGGDWLMGTMLNLTELRSVGMKEIPLCASNAFYIGSATVMMQGDYLSVQLNFYPEANVEVHGASVYVITQGASLTGDPAYSGAAALSIGDWADVTGASTALLYLPMQVSYDPSGLPALSYDLGSASTQEQLNLWQQNLSGAAAERFCCGYGLADRGDPRTLLAGELQRGIRQCRRMEPAGTIGRKLRGARLVKQNSKPRLSLTCERRGLLFFTGFSG